LPQQAARKPGLTIYPEIINIDVNTGEFFSQAINISNTGNVRLNVTVRKQGAISDMLNLAFDRAGLEPNQSIGLGIKLFAGANSTPGTYTGQLIFEAVWLNGTRPSSLERDVLVDIDIKSIRPLLNMDLNITNEGKRLSPGEYLMPSINVMNFSDEHANISLEYIIMDDHEKVVYRKTETIAVETQASFLRSFRLPTDLEAGNYTLSVVAMYGNQTARAADVFAVLPLVEPAGSAIQLDILAKALIPPLLVSLLAIIFGARRRRQGRAAGRHEPGPEKPGRRKYTAWTKAQKPSARVKQPEAEKAPEAGLAAPTEAEEAMPSRRPERHPKGKEPATEPALIQPETTDIGEVLSNYRLIQGSEICIRGEFRLHEEVKLGGTRIYWYVARDATGEMMVSSGERIEEGEKTVLGTVQKTVSGSTYLKFGVFA